MKYHILDDAKPTPSYYSLFFLKFINAVMLPSHNSKLFDNINQIPFIFQSISTFLCLKFIALAVVNMWGKPAIVKIYITNIFSRINNIQRNTFTLYMCVCEREIH